MRVRESFQAQLQRSQVYVCACVCVVVCDCVWACVLSVFVCPSNRQFSMRLFIATASTANTVGTRVSVLFTHTHTHTTVECPWHTCQYVRVYVCVCFSLHISMFASVAQAIARSANSSRCSCYCCWWCRFCFSFNERQRIDTRFVCTDWTPCTPCTLYSTSYCCHSFTFACFPSPLRSLDSPCYYTCWIYQPRLLWFDSLLWATFAPLTLNH